MTAREKAAKKRIGSGIGSAKEK
jgi:hypothetical protein